MIRLSKSSRIITVELEEGSEGGGAPQPRRGLRRSSDGPTSFVMLQICICSSAGPRESRVKSVAGIIKDSLELTSGWRSSERRVLKVDL